MRETLRSEVEAFLRRHGPATSTEIAKGVHVRRSAVDAVLTSDGFVRIPHPSGRSIHAVCFDLSRRVPRAERLLVVLRDGREHSRAEIVAGGVDHTNNAAAELRRLGYDVRFNRADDVYWIDSFPPEALSEQDESLPTNPPSKATAATGRRSKPKSCSLNATAEEIAA